MKRSEARKACLVFMLLSVFLIVGCGGGGGDNTHPSVLSMTPSDGAVGVGTDVPITAVFSEEMDPATITSQTFTLFWGTTPVAVAGSVTYSGVTAVFAPSGDLEADTVHTATITTGAMDEAGNALAADMIWSFTTAAGPDTVAPIVSSTAPADADTNVTLNRNITATFSEEMDSSTITSQTFTLAQGETPVPGVVTYLSSIATLNPTDDLAADTEYDATITVGAQDLVGNALTAEKIWSFTTGAEADTVAPTVSSTMPADLATNVYLNADITATFSEAMDPTTINETTFTLTAGTTSVPGAVSYAGTVATFNATSDFAASTTYDATITMGAMDLAGNALTAVKTWSFSTAAGAGPDPVDLATAGDFVILSKTGITNVPDSVVTGDMGVSPILVGAITGFALSMDASGEFSTSSNVIGSVFAPDYAAPTPAKLTTAVSDMEAAYTDAAGRVSPDELNLGAGAIGGLTLAPGLYKWTTAVTIATDVTLNGGPNDVWIFQVGGAVTVAAATSVLLDGGAVPENIFWQSADTVILGAGAHFEGIVLSSTGVNLAAGASVNGRLLAQTAVTLNTNTVTAP